MSLRNLQRGKYKSPSGQIVYFDYMDIDSSYLKKAAVFESAVGNGTYVQPNGHTSGRLPMACYISGDDYDRKADAFLSAVLEDGVGVLSHPISNEVHVVPVGEVRRSDRLVEAAGQVIFGVEFYETTGLQIGESGGLPQSFESLIQASAVDFSEKVNLSNAMDKASFKNRVAALLKRISSTLKKASGAVAEVNQAIEDTGDSIGRGLDVLLGEPLSLAFQCQLLIGEPRRENSAVHAKLDAYQNLANNIFARTIEEPVKYSKEAENQFGFNRMMSRSIISNFAMVAADGKWLKRSDYILNAERLDELLTLYQAWVGAGFEILAIDTIDATNMDTGVGDYELIQLVSSAISQIISQSFAAKTEMRMVTTCSEALIPLCFRLYGTALQAQLDNFIENNNLGGDELIEIPKGREIVWYV